MPRTSSTWRSRAVLVVGVLLATAASASGASARLCLPPIFEGGYRLHDRFNKNTSWLAPALMQHEACWRAPASKDELRVFLFGNSGIYGFPLSADQTLASVLNRRFEKSKPPVHFFNLGYVNTYHMKDALILRESLDLHPDIVIFAVTLDDFRRLVDTKWTWSLVQFFEINRSALRHFAAEEPPGVQGALAQQADANVDLDAATPLTYLRQIGRMVKVVVRDNARDVRRWFEPEYDPDANEFKPSIRTLRGRIEYDCEEVQLQFNRFFKNWKSRNVLAYLQWIEKTSGVDVIVLNWPTVERPIGSCYNVRYTKEAYADFNQWVREEALARQLQYLDLHDLLEPPLFFDSLHPTKFGTMKIANEVDAAVRSAIHRRQTRGAN